MALARIAVVCREPALRLEVARAFDDAPPEWSIDLHDEVPDQVDVVVGTDPGPAIDVLFDPSHPDEVIVAVATALKRNGTTIVVTSPCGGSGVTTAAIHLAASLSAADEPVCYVDLDPWLGGAARLGMPSDVRTFVPADGLLTVPHEGGFRALFVPSQAKSALALALETFEVCVADVPAPGANDDILDATSAVIVMVPPTRPGVERARAFLQRHDSTKWLIVGNRIGPGGEATRSALERRLGRRFDLMLPCSALLRDREDHGALLTTPLSRWKRAFDRLVHALSR